LISDPKCIAVSDKLPPNVNFISGLSFLDSMHTANLRVRRKHEANPPYFKTWHEKNLVETRLSWLMMSETLLPNIRTGSVGTFSSDKSATSYVFNIKFDRPFSGTPSVIAWLTHLDCEQHKRTAVWVSESDGTKEGFTLRISRDPATVLYDAGADWLAYESNAPISSFVLSIQTDNHIGLYPDNIQMFDNGHILYDCWPEKEPISGTLYEFGSKFPTTPTAIAVIRKFDMETMNRWGGCANIRLRVDIPYITKDFCLVRAQSWWDTWMYSADFAIIVAS
jgi:hypothetical protein